MQRSRNRQHTKTTPTPVPGARGRFTRRGGGRTRCAFQNAAIFLLAAPLLALASPQPRTVTVTDPFPHVSLGSRERGDVFADTLIFRDGTGRPVPLNRAESTCDCVLPQVLDGGRLAYRFHVEQAEPSGPIEKIVYLSTGAEEPLDLLRLRLVLTVEPGPEEGDSGEKGQGGDSKTRRSADPAYADTILTKGGDHRLTLLFFHSPGCQSCRRVLDYTLPHLRDRWGEKLHIETVNLDEPRGYGRLLAVREHYGVEETRSPYLFAVGDTAIAHSEELAAALDRAIGAALKRGQQTFTAPEVGEGEAKGRAERVFRSLSFWTVLGAGLLDGLNPCAFATLVFFVSLLAYTGSSRKQTLVVGIGFTATVFVVYLLLGLGAFRALQALGVYDLLAKGIYLATLVLLLVLFVLSVRDTVRYYRTGQTRDAALQLSAANKRRIHTVMRKGLKTGNLLLGSIAIGALVTLFEAACTGQVYLPTIVLMLNDPDLAPNAFLYLVLYNLLFVFPLVVVFLLAYAGVRSERFADWAKRNYGLTRILLSLLFLALAALILLQGADLVL